ncbi:MAG: sulfatase [Candidatus Sumerlaeota bacterium]
MNVLLITTDQHRWDYVGWAADSKMQTPNLDRLARGGCAFHDAITTSPLCVPARCSLMTGLYAHQTGNTGNVGGDLNPVLPMFPKALKNAGYRTEIVGKGHWTFHVTGSGREPTRENYKAMQAKQCEAFGWDFWWEACGKEMPRHHYFDWCRELEDGGVSMEDYISELDRIGQGCYDNSLPLIERMVPAEWSYDPELYVDRCIGRHARERLEVLTACDQPFLLWASFCGPHPQYDPPVDYLKQEIPQDGVEPIAPEGEEITPEEKRHLTELRRRYRAMIRLIDEEVGQLIDLLEASGKSEDTLVIFTTDHGEMLGDHRRLNKSTYYRSAISIPLVMRGPGIPSGGEYYGPVELTDVTATILEAAGLEPGAILDHSPSRSLLPVARDPENASFRDFAFSELGGWQMIKNGNYKYVAGPSGGDGEPWEWMVDLQEDPLELVDVSEDAKYASAKEKMRNHLLKTYQMTPAPKITWIS